MSPAQLRNKSAKITEKGKGHAGPYSAQWHKPTRWAGQAEPSVAQASRAARHAGGELAGSAADEVVPTGFTAVPRVLWWGRRGEAGSGVGRRRAGAERSTAALWWRCTRGRRGWEGAREARLGSRDADLGPKRAVGAWW